MKKKGVELVEGKRYKQKGIPLTLLLWKIDCIFLFSSFPIRNKEKCEKRELKRETFFFLF